MIEDRLRRPGLLDPALVHDRHLIGDFERLLLIVRDQDAGDADLLMEAPQPLPQFQADLGVQSAERLVEQQHLGLGGQRPRQGDALPLAARKLCGQSFPQFFEPDQVKQLAHSFLDVALALVADTERKGDVVEHRHVAKQGIMLKDKAHVALAGAAMGDVIVMDHHRAVIGDL